jgi:glycosyltransferase involved in cell wall biosynthesis
MHPRRRVLHVLHRAGRGGIETAMMEVFRRIDRARYRFDFAVRTALPGDYDDEIRELGGRILVCPHHREPLGFARRLRRVLVRHGPYDAVHSHVEHHTGMVLAVAAAAGVPVRIAHIHNDRSGEPASALRRGYRRLMQAGVARFATHGFAPSADAARFLFGERWRADRRWRVRPYGIDLAPFRRPPERARLRRELGIPAEALVVGHVGRFDPQKNHALLLRILEHWFALEPSTFALLVGAGALQGQVMAAAATAGIAPRIVFAGVRADVPDLMQAAMDVFLFPSKHEGLGLVAIEAQAAGLPCVLSNAIPPEAAALPDRVRRVALDAPLPVWVAALRAALEQGRDPQAAARLERSVYAVDASVAAYAAAYDGAAAPPLSDEAQRCAALPA